MTVLIYSPHVKFKTFIHLNKVSAFLAKYIGVRSEDLSVSPFLREGEGGGSYTRLVPKILFLIFFPRRIQVINTGNERIIYLLGHSRLPYCCIDDATCSIARLKQSFDFLLICITEKSVQGRAQIIVRCPQRKPDSCCLKIFGRGRWKFVCSYCHRWHHTTHETNQKSDVWKSATENAPNKAKMELSAINTNKPRQILIKFRLAIK